MRNRSYVERFLKTQPVKELAFTGEAVGQTVLAN